VSAVAFVTYEGLPELTSDDWLAIEALRARGHEAQAAVWTDATVDWPAFDAVVLRSCWDYHLRPIEFATWLDRLAHAGVALHNSAALARWNMDKRYLRDLARDGVPIVATRWIEKGAAPSLAALRDETGWTDVVIKPAVSATAWQLHRLPAAVQVWPAELATALDALDFLAQPFVDDIATGEWSLVFFDGRFSHAVLKRPRAGEFRVQSEYGGRAERATPSETLLAQATRILGGLRERPLYARVDGVDTRSGFQLLELELLEPTLFLAADAAAPARFADAIEQRLS
jgi:glutathione synthase/RimK-type ligase-like ATP-grasp enzyme